MYTEECGGCGSWCCRRLSVNAEQRCAVCSMTYARRYITPDSSGRRPTHAQPSPVRHITLNHRERRGWRSNATSVPTRVLDIRRRVCEQYPRVHDLYLSVQLEFLNCHATRDESRLQPYSQFRCRRSSTLSPRGSYPNCIHGPLLLVSPRLFRIHRGRAYIASSYSRPMSDAGREPDGHWVHALAASDGRHAEQSVEQTGPSGQSLACRPDHTRWL